MHAEPVHVFGKELEIMFCGRFSLTEFLPHFGTFLLQIFFVTSKTIDLAKNNLTNRALETLLALVLY